MSLNSIGDLAQGLVLRNRGAQIRQQIETLTQELATGQIANPTERLKGDYSQIADMDRSLKRLEGYRVATSEANLFAEATQGSLNLLNDTTSDLSSSLLSFGTSNQAVSHAQASIKAQNELETMISSLNVQVGGVNLFSGVATDQQALQSADVLLTALRPVLGAESSPADMAQAAADWFDDPGGFSATMYGGSDQSLAPMQISENEQVTLRLRADDPVFRDAFLNTALAALADDPSLGLTPDGKTALLKDAGLGLLNAGERIVQVQAETGAAQERIEEAQTRNSTSKTSLEFARGQLLQADPYETATKLEDVQFQLEALYTTTVRNSRLSLVNFL